MEIELSLETLLKKASALYNLELNITILTDLSGNRLIGQCKKISKKTYIIRLHKTLLEEFGQSYLDDVLTHEFAHAVQMELFKNNKPHSREWKGIVEALSGEKYGTHKINYNPAKSKTYKTYLYKCHCGEHKLTSIRHNRAVKKRMVYVCKKCGGKLAFDKKI